MVCRQYFQVRNVHLTISIRRRIPGEERKAYVKAVNCLMELPNVYPNVTGPK